MVTIIYVHVAVKLTRPHNINIITFMFVFVDFKTWSQLI